MTTSGRELRLSLAGNYGPAGPLRCHSAEVDIAKKEKDKHLGLRIDTELHYKLHYISQYEGRSANGEVIYLIRKAIEDFEKQHGKIELP